MLIYMKYCKDPKFAFVTVRINLTQKAINIGLIGIEFSTVNKFSRERNVASIVHK